MKFSDFFKKSLVLLGVCIALAGLYLYDNDSAEARNAIAVGIGLGYANALLGFAFLAWGYRRSNKKFMISVIGGMILRFMLLFSFLFILIVASKMAKTPLIVSLIGVYFAFLALELVQIYLHVQTERG